MKGPQEIKFFRVMDILFRFSVGPLFAISGYTKLLEPPEDFLQAILAYQILKEDFAVLASVMMPWTELIFGVFLILGLWRRVSLKILWLLNSVFIGALSSVIIRKLPIESCGCFGENFLSMSIPQVLYLDLILWGVFFLFYKYRALENGNPFAADTYFEEVDKRLSRPS